MVTTRKRSHEVQETAPPADESQQQAVEPQQQLESTQQQPESTRQAALKHCTTDSKKRQKRQTRNEDEDQEAQHEDQVTSEIAAAPAGHGSSEPEETAAVDPSTDLLPVELLQQLSQARKTTKSAAGTHTSHKRQHQAPQHHNQQKKQKQRVVQLQKGPVQVAVLPAVAAAAEAGTALSAGAAVRQQLLESRIQRSKVMLQAPGPGRC